MKLTNRGRRIKDNSRRTGAGAARVKARQQGALDRFSILPFDEWCKRNGRYVERRNAELDSLKRSLNVR